MASDPLRKDGSTMKAERRLQPVKDASHLYEVERRDRHAERPGFRISELQLSPTQTVPWHYHTKISDTFYVLEGEMRLFLQQPKEEVRLGVGQSYVAAGLRGRKVPRYARDDRVRR
jgi:quercetin dioxygenase-like cupin family protein